jgi:transposase
MVGEATVKRLVRRFRAVGTVEPEPMGGDRVSRIPLSEGDHLVALVEDMPDATIVELIEAYETRHGVLLSPASMSRTLAREGITRKKKRSSRKSTTRRVSPTSATSSCRTNSR